MIYDASTPALPREGSSVQHASFTDERVARDSVIFVPHITPGSYCLVFFVRGLRHHLDEAPDGRGIRSTVGSIEADRFECVAREQLAKNPANVRGPASTSSSTSALRWRRLHRWFPLEGLVRTSRRRRASRIGRTASPAARGWATRLRGGGPCDPPPSIRHPGRYCGPGRALRSRVRFAT
jgi:hypothetical protein